MNQGNHQHVFLFYLKKYYSLPITFHTIALKAAPMNGPMMNTHNSLKALPPSNTAGAMLRAGLTDVPV